MYRFNGVLSSQKVGVCPQLPKNGGPFPPLPKSSGPKNYAYENSLARAAVEVKAPKSSHVKSFHWPKINECMNV